jgi:hypothetical protein
MRTIPGKRGGEGAHRTMNAGYYPSALSVKTRELGPSGAHELLRQVRLEFYEKWHRHVCVNSRRTYLGLLCRWEGRYACGGHGG